MRKRLLWLVAFMMCLANLQVRAQSNNYASQVSSDILPWVESVGQIFGLTPDALDSMGWQSSYTVTCPASVYYKMKAIVANPRYYYCPTGYYRLRSDRGGYLYLENENPQTENSGSSRATAASSLVKLERTADGGFYIRMQGLYLQTPTKDKVVELGTQPDKFYPVVKTPGGKVTFTTRMGNYSALHCGYSRVQGYTTADDASYWTVTPAPDFQVTSTIQDGDKYYATMYVPFAASPVAPTKAYTMAERDGKAVAQRQLDVVPDSTGVVLRGDDATMQVAVADTSRADVPGNVVLRNAVADSSYYYFNKAFLLRSGSGYDNNTYYRENLSTTSKLYFWQQALVILMVEDRYMFRGDHSVASLITNLLDAFTEQNTGGLRQGNAASQYAHNHNLSDWTWNEYNDDLLWAGLAYIRGYQITGKSRFLEQAKWDFDFMYNRGWDDQLGGGIWWDIRKNEKSGLSNNPAICMASYLYEATGDTTYLNKAKAIYDWVAKTLRHANGSVEEKINKDGSLPSAFSVYNMGTFIEGAAALYKLTGEASYRTDALKTMEYVMINRVDDKGIMSNWKTDGTWQSEFARGAAFLLAASPKDWNYRSKFTTKRTPITLYRWLRRNADAAWDTRDRVNNITGCQWSQITPTYPSPGKTWECDACASAVVMTNVVPEVLPGSRNETYVTLDDHSLDFEQADTTVAEEDPVKLDADGVMRVGAPINVVCVGNSITEGYGNSSSYYAWPAQMGRLLGPKYSVLNCGVSGTTMMKSTDAPYWKTSRFTDAKNANPQILIIALGTNDADPWRWDQWGDTFKSDYLDMVNEFRANGRNPIIYCTLAPPIFPTASSRQNTYIETKLMPTVRQIASEINAYLIDFHSGMQDKGEVFPDNVHPNDAGASLLAAIAAGRITATQKLQGLSSVNLGKADSTTVTVPKGAKATLSPVSGQNGTWSWTGPDGFTYNDRVLTIDDVQRGGTYTVTFTDSLGHRSLLNYQINITGESAGAITPYVMLTNGNWQQTTEVTARPGFDVNFGPQVNGSPEGTWQWRGPDGFTAFTRSATVSSMNNLRAGDYGVTFTDTLGRQSTAVFHVKVSGELYCQDLVSYVRAGDTWQQTDEASVAAGTNVTMGPQPSSGSWSWTGPNGYSYSGREARINNFSADKAGQYVGTRTTDAGCQDQIVVTLTLKN